MSYRANLAYHALDRQEYAAALTQATQLLLLDSGKKYGHFLSAAALAGQGEVVPVFEHLNLALTHGWDSRRELEINPAFAPLHQHPDWQVLLSRLG